MNAWDYNYAVLRGRWPRIAEAIKNAPIDQCQALLDTPANALIYRDRQITSAFDPLDEAKWQAEGLPLEAEAIYCYGIGLGHLPAVLAARHKHVCVVLMNLSVARVAMESSEQRWLSAPHVGMTLAEAVPIMYVPYACVPMECRLADEQGHAMRDRIFAHLNIRYIEDFHFGLNAKQDAKHVDGNQVHVENDKHVSELFGTLKGRPVALIGGGPSLMGELDWLKQAKADGTTVITASTSLRLLLEHGIQPDIVVVVDTAPEQTAHLNGVMLMQTEPSALVYHPTVTPEFIGQWQGKRYFYRNPAELYTSGTVMHTAADLAVQMGAGRITLLGCDFCYPAGKSHIDGGSDYKEIQARPTLLDTVDGYGNKTTTDFNLAQYHRHLEDYIERKGKGIEWFKRGKAGVPVRGAAWTG